MTAQDWLTILFQSFQTLWPAVVGYLVSIIVALLVFIVGLIVATGLKSLVEKGVGALKLDAMLAKLGIGEYVERAGLKLNSGKVLGDLVYWFVFGWFVLAILRALGLTELSDFLSRALNYVPNVIIAVAIMLVAVVVARFLRHLVVASVLGARLHSSKFLGSLTWWAVAIFGFHAALKELGIDPYILEALVTGFIAMLALAMGLAFGLGGKEIAADALRKLKDQVVS